MSLSLARCTGSSDATPELTPTAFLTAFGVGLDVTAFGSVVPPCGFTIDGRREALDFDGRGVGSTLHGTLRENKKKIVFSSAQNGY